MNMSPNGIALLRRLEGCSTVAYQDVAGFLTIGIGHLLTRSEVTSGKILINGVYYKWRKGLTGEQCDLLLGQDVHWAEGDVSRLVTVPLEQYQFDALVSFCFNVGGAAFRDSTLLKRLNAKDYAAVPAQMMRWIHAGGKELLGLKNRRVWECKCWRGEEV